MRRQVSCAGGYGFGLVYILLQRAALGCKVDGDQHKMGSYTQADAEVIAATVAGMPDSFGSIRMAISVAKMARAGITPDWMPGAVPRCVPIDLKRNRHGNRAVSVVVGTETVLVSGKWRTIEVLACPVTWRPHPEQIASAGPWLLMTSDTLRNLEAPRARGHQQPPKPGFCRNEIHQEHSAKATTWFFRNIFGCGNTCSHLDCRAANNQIRSALCSLKVFLITHEPQPV